MYVYIELNWNLHWTPNTSAVDRKCKCWQSMSKLYIFVCAVIVSQNQSIEWHILFIRRATFIAIRTIEPIVNVSVWFVVRVRVCGDTLNVRDTTHTMLVKPAKLVTDSISTDFWIGEPRSPVPAQKHHSCINSFDSILCIDFLHVVPFIVFSLSLSLYLFTIESIRYRMSSFLLFIKHSLFSQWAILCKVLSYSGRGLGVGSRVAPQFQTP